MNHFVPCSSCGRHVRASETVCPFCDGERDPASSPSPVLPKGRLSRAATLAFSALVGASTMAVGCIGDDDDSSGKGEGAGESAGGETEGGDAGVPTGGLIGSGGIMAVPVYGAPAPEGGTLASGARSGAGGAATGGRDPVDPTGGRASGGTLGRGGRGSSSGNTGIAGQLGTGGISVFPVYGAPPEPIGGKPASAGAGPGGNPGGIPGPIYGAAPPPNDEE